MDIFLDLKTFQECTDVIRTRVYYKPDESTVVRPTTCPNCGAPITNYKCEYCDTIF